MLCDSFGSLLVSLLLYHIQRDWCVIIHFLMVMFCVEVLIAIMLCALRSLFGCYIGMRVFHMVL